MNIGIIIHSQSGHTYSAALKLQEKLSTAGHKAVIEQLKPIGDVHPGVKNLRLETIPGIDKYEGIVLAAPVWAFSISPVLKAYLEQLTSLQGKKIASFVTMGFPLAWMGGNRAINQLKKTCLSKGGTLSATAVVTHSGNNQKVVNSMIDKLNEVF